MFQRILAAGAFVFAISAPPAHATEDSLDADFSCLTVSFLLANSEDEAVRNAGTLSAMYWLGRVDNAGAHDQVEQRLRAAVPALTDDFVRSELQRCGLVLTARGQEIQAIGARMQADGL